MHFLKQISIIFLVAIFSSCGTSDAEGTGIDLFNKQDSTIVVKALLAHLRKEFEEGQKVFDEGYSGCLTNLEVRDFFVVKCNNQGQNMVRGEDNAGITKSLIEYYAVNMLKNDVTNSFPMYSSFTLKHVEAELIVSENEYLSTKESKMALSKIVEFKRLQVNEWKKKLRILKILNADDLREPHFHAKVEMNYLTQDQRSFTIDSVILAYYHIRELASKHYLNENYLSVFNKSLDTNNVDFHNKMEVISILHPIRVIDIPYIMQDEERRKHYSPYRSSPPPIENELVY